MSHLYFKETNPILAGDLPPLTPCQQNCVPGGMGQFDDVELCFDTCDDPNLYYDKPCKENCRGKYDPEKDQGTQDDILNCIRTECARKKDANVQLVNFSKSVNAMFDRDFHDDNNISFTVGTVETVDVPQHKLRHEKDVIDDRTRDYILSFIPGVTQAHKEMVKQLDHSVYHVKENWDNLDVEKIVSETML